MNEIEIFTDGSCRNKKGGWGWIATFRERKLCTGKGRAEKTTHQRMELFAVIDALETFSVCDLKIIVYSDSAYVVNCMNKKWYEKWETCGWMTTKGENVKNMELWERLLKTNYKKVKFIHVHAHKTDSSKYTTFNNMADAIAKR